MAFINTKGKTYFQKLMMGQTPGDVEPRTEVEVVTPLN